MCVRGGTLAAPAETFLAVSILPTLQEFPMKRFPLMVASAVIGLALLAGVTREVAAKSSSAIPPLGGACMYYWYTCSYDDGSYWTNCIPGGGAGWIPTSFAQIICTTYVNAS
jgi:hypothetical protein